MWRWWSRMLLMSKTSLFKLILLILLFLVNPNTTAIGIETNVIENGSVHAQIRSHNGKKPFNPWRFMQIMKETEKVWEIIVWQGCIKSSKILKTRRIFKACHYNADCNGTRGDGFKLSLKKYEAISVEFVGLSRDGSISFKNIQNLGKLDKRCCDVSRLVVKLRYLCEFISSLKVY